MVPSGYRMGVAEILEIDTEGVSGRDVDARLSEGEEMFDIRLSHEEDRLSRLESLFSGKLSSVPREAIDLAGSRELCRDDAWLLLLPLALSSESFQVKNELSVLLGRDEVFRPTEGWGLVVFTGWENIRREGSDVAAAGDEYDRMVLSRPGAFRLFVSSL